MNKMKTKTTKEVKKQSDEKTKKTEKIAQKKVKGKEKIGKSRKIKTETIKENKKISKTSKIKTRELNLFIENFVIIQKALSDLAISFKSLEERLTNFLNLVEKASKMEFGEGAIMKEALEVESVERAEREKREEKEEKILTSLEEKIETLLEQNKTIAEGMLLLQKILKEKLEKG